MNDYQNKKKSPKLKSIRINHSHILFEDNNYIIVNKKAGWILDLGFKKDQSTLSSSLKSFLKNRDKLQNTPFLNKHSNLKKNDSGIVIYSKNTDAKKHLSDLSEKKMIATEVLNEKNYHTKRVSFFDKFTNKKITVSLELMVEKEQRLQTNKYVIFYKPFGVLCQFTKDSEEQKSLADFNLPEGIYPAGRLDKDSEGLLLLSNDGQLMDKVTSPKNEKSKVYLVQIEGVPTKQSLSKMMNGLMIQGKMTLPCKVRVLDDFIIKDRTPPIRKREKIPTTWIEVILKEGRNRQVRRMTAAINHPTLRLIRSKILNLSITDLEEGSFLEITRNDIKF